ncbi:glycosyltransferase family 9 protein, partial [candidate division KSB1 bacterium]
FDVGKSSWAHDRKIKYRTDINIADLYLEFACDSGIKPDHNDLEMFFTEEESGEFENKGVPSGEYIVISPGAGYKEKYWFNNKWAETADKLVIKYNMPVVFSGGPGEAGMIEEIVSLMSGKAQNFAGELTLRESALLIKNSSLLLSVDSAAVHIASAVKTPVIALYGPTNPVHWGPYPNGCNNKVISRVKEFSLGRGSTNKEGGMELITVDDVLCAADDILNNMGMN